MTIIFAQLVRPNARLVQVPRYVLLVTQLETIRTSLVIGVSHCAQLENALQITFAHQHAPHLSSQVSQSQQVQLQSTLPVVL
jgi:hypothetical protein